MKYCPDQTIRLEATARLAFQHCEMGRKKLGRMLYEKYKKKKGSSVSYYNRNSRERAGLAIEEKKARKAKEATSVEPEEDAKPYDYDNMENNIEEDSSNEEEVVEETATEEVPVEETVTEEVVNTEENGENN